MLKKVVLLLIVMGSMMFTGVANAENKIDRIDISVLVKNDGGATIEEVWNTTVDSGSQFAKNFEQLNYSSITKFEVKDETGDKYTYIKTWDESASRLDKFTSNSYRTRMNGDTTLYWGLGNYGQRAYILEYDVDNFICDSKDGQLSYFTFIAPSSLYPSNITLNIEFEKDIDLSKLKYSIYGLTASNEIIDNKTIRLTSKPYSVNGNSYLSTLMKFDAETFDCDTTINKSYDDIALECDTKSGLNVQIRTTSLKEIIIVGAILLLLGLIIYYIVSEIIIRKRAKNETGLSVSYLGAKIRKSVDVDTNSMLNEENSIYEIYTIGYEYGIIQNLYSIISALILKWVLKGYLDITFIENTYDFKVIKKSEIEPENSFEDELFNNIIHSGEININIFESIVREKAQFIKDWINNILLSESRMLLDKGLLETVEISKRAQKYMTFTEFKCTDELNKKANKVNEIRQAVKYINLIDEGNELLSNIDNIVYAQLFGITNDIRNKTKDFEKTIIAINRINQVITARMEYFNRMGRRDKIGEVMDKVARELGI